ncbi:MAG: HupE/UreJ family protein [Candidatus Krumholzibacteria bacterium]|nr:HupE/UreJ family protein [Candidatus Krumholzibacteria bacterium]MDH5271322.1 HupE/UreJ family protein [Candidatus Krumholzibacteria bacterium]MDH5626872.1 HupE/UreJ family protein [Candidatus Krumholzibacteria bacterium]
MTRQRRVATALFVWACIPATAHAHLVTTGFGSFYDGMAHLVITPSDVLLVLALALFAGQRGAATARSLLVVLPGAWLVGGVAGRAWPVTTDLPVVTTLSFMIVGLLVALDRRLPSTVAVGLAVVAGGLNGFLNGAVLRTAGMDRLALIGAVTAVFVVATLVPSWIVGLRRQWARIVVRVAGSWITAIGILMLGWVTRRQ